uniref:Uncharacterized protein n=1 Tax=Methylophaga nitratireducenticrescens TaxID=754476 RepID=I1XIL9_METNJ
MANQQKKTRPFSRAKTLWGAEDFKIIFCSSADIISFVVEKI